MDFADRSELDAYLSDEPYVQEHVWETIEVERMNVVIPGHNPGQGSDGNS